MSKKILIIESDSAFAGELASALEGKGFAVRVSGDGKEGLELARVDRPDAIVLCVELPKMSGYSICNKLKKDDALRTIPLVITSSEATPETFEQHRKLKTRAEDYLIKPFGGAALVERLGALVGLPEVAAEEEVLPLSDAELEPVEAEPVAPAKAASPSAAGSLPEEDEDLKLLDSAFEAISREPEATAAPRAAEAQAGAGRLPPEDERPATAPAEALEAEADAALEALGSGADEEPTQGPAEALAAARPAPEAAPVRGASQEALRAAGIPVVSPGPAAAPPPAESWSVSEILPLAEPAAEREVTGERDLREIRGLRQELSALRKAQEETEAETARREGELRLSRGKLETLAAAVKKLEADLQASREEARLAGERAAAAEAELGALRTRLEEAERGISAKGAAAAESAARAQSLEREVDELRTELVVARGEAEGARTEIEKRTAEMRKRLQELEAVNDRNEERVLKAYQKIKTDEKLREKTRKALAIALQLLDERLPSEPAKDPRPAARD
jgi:CheY-like chemotaxis protein